jgi:mRNA guanylyltransferase
VESDPYLSDNFDLPRRGRYTKDPSTTKSRDSLSTTGGCIGSECPVIRRSITLSGEKMGGSTPNIAEIGPQVTDPSPLSELRWEVARLLNRNNERFPGAQPVSFCRRHFEELKRQDYYLCEKTDGIRCLMYIHNGKGLTYLVDRKNDYYYISNIDFPNPSGGFHTDTILDGELVIDTHPGKASQLMYLVFDCMVLDGERLMHRTLDKRLAYFRDNVYNPYVKFRKDKPPEPTESFIVDWKRMEFGYGTPKMFKETLPALPHGNDGLIFTCRSTPYQFGTDQHIIKWKPADENSIDCRMTFEFPLLDPDSRDEDQSPFLDYSAMPHIKLAVYGGDRQPDIPYGTLVIDGQQWEEWKALGKPLNDQVVECSLIDKGTWRFLRFRHDKHEANHISVVDSVMESILDKVSEEDLIEASKSIRDAWKERAKEEARTAANGHNGVR